MRKQTQEVTKAANGKYLVVTWEWNNGWNLISSRPATETEVSTRRVE